MKHFIVVLSVITMSLAACTKKEEAAAPAAPTAAESAAPAAGAVDPNQKADVEVAIGTEGDAMTFDKKEFEVKAGQTIKITFKNNASRGGFQHNLLVVKPGTEQAVANAAIQAGNDKGWVPAGDANVLANTKLVNAGETDSITFVAPAAGVYPYICTFPGHSMIMKGVMHVK
jgi:azurin